jgi:hypothetical protein
MTQFQIYDKKLKEKLKTVANSKAKKYLHDIGYNSSSYLLPEYYVATGFKEMTLDPLTYSRAGKPKRTKAISIITPKGRMSWRRFSLLHPYAYWHLSDEITKQSNWLMIQNKLTTQNKIASYSTPRLDVKQKPQGMGVQAWKMLNEIDVLKDSSGYQYYVSTDLKNFYPSIYTHSIAWAIEGKPESRADGDGSRLFGNHLDKLFQNSREGQTNGIPVGCLVSDITAEVILSTIDTRLSEVLTFNKIKFVGARYRDDYRFLCPTKTDGEVLLKSFSRLLQNEFDLQLNDDKTKIEDDIVAGSMRPWDLELRDSVTFSRLYDPKDKEYDGTQIRTVLLSTYMLQKKYLGSRVGVQIISKLTKKLKKIKNLKIRQGDAEVIIALMRKLILLREDVTPHAMLFLDLILGFLPDVRKVVLITEMHGQYMGSEDNEYQEVWLYRLCLHHAPAEILTLFGASENPLIQMLDIKSKPHWLYYDSIDEMSESDKTELEKFSFVNHKVLTASKAVPISAESLDIFPKY